MQNSSSKKVYRKSYFTSLFIKLTSKKKLYLIPLFIFPFKNLEQHQQQTQEKKRKNFLNVAMC